MFYFLDGKFFRFKNFIANKEYERVKPQYMMFAPYKRILVMQLTLIFSGMLVVILKLPIIGLVFMIALKILFDLRAHLAEHLLVGSKNEK